MIAMRMNIHVERALLASQMLFPNQFAQVNIPRVFNTRDVEALIKSEKFTTERNRIVGTRIARAERSIRGGKCAERCKQ